MGRDNLVIADNKVFDKFLSIFLCFIYFISVIFIDNTYFRDRDIYENLYAKHAMDIYYSYDGISVFFNEPIFLIFNEFLSNFFDSSQIVFLQLVIIVGSILFFLLYFSKNSILLFLGLMVIFLSPFIFHLQFVIFRQALATILFFHCLFFIDKKELKYFLVILTSFIHSLFFLVVGFYILYNFLKKKLSLNKILLIFFILSIFANLMFFTVGSYLGLRQLNESHVAAEISVGGGAFYLFLFTFIYFKIFLYEKNNEIYDFIMILLIFFLTTYYFLPISGRLMSSVMLLIILFLVRKFNLYNIILLSIICLVSFYTAYSGYIENGSLNVSFGTLIDYMIGFKWLL